MLFEPSQSSTQSTTSSGFLKPTDLQRSQTTVPAEPQPTKTNLNRTAIPKRKFNLLSENSDEDDDDEGDGLFKFDKNPVPIKRAKPDSVPKDEDNSTLFAFSSSAASSQAVTTRKAPAARKEIPASRSETSLGRTIQSLHNMSIKPVQITLLTGWLSRSDVKKEEGEPDSLVPKSEMDESGDPADSKHWVNQIQNAFEVRVRKMQLVNRSVASSAGLNVSDAGGKNYKAFVKVIFSSSIS